MIHILHLFASNESLLSIRLVNLHGKVEVMGNKELGLLHYPFATIMSISSLLNMFS